MDPRCKATDGRPLHILCYLHAIELGGVERTAVRLCGAWVDTARVTLALGRGGRPPTLDPRVAVRHAPRPPVSPCRWETLWMILWLPWIVMRVRPDVIFCAGNTYTAVAFALKLLLGRRCPPIVAKISNSLVRPDLPAIARRPYSWWCRVQGRSIDHVVGMTAAMTREARQELAIPARRTTTIASPLFEPAVFDRLSAPRPLPAPPGGETLFVATGRLEPQKNFALLLRAFARTAGGGRDRLAILGEGGERARLRALAERLGIADRVELVGQVADVALWLGRADALILSSDYEGVPAAVIEAMAAGLPVIATDCCVSMADLLADGRGVLVPPRDPDALAAAIASRSSYRHDPDAQRAYARRHGVREAAAAYIPVFRTLATAAGVSTFPTSEPAFL